MTNDQLKRERDDYRNALVTAALELRSFRISRVDVAVYIERQLAKHQINGDRSHIDVGS